MHSVSLGKDPDSKFEIWFLLNVYCFHTTVKWKNYKSNRGKAGTVCVPLIQWSLTSFGPSSETNTYICICIYILFVCACVKYVLSI